MYPYDFVRIDWSRGVQRRPYQPHDRFTGLSGRIEGTITTLTPFFIPQHKAHRSPKPFLANRQGRPIIPQHKAHRSPKPFLTNRQGHPIIPGSSLKGLFRSLVETIGYGCWWLFDGQYKKGQVNYTNRLPRPFQRCHDKNKLCVACRMFGLVQGSQFSLLGHVGFEDAICQREFEHPPIYTIILSSPKPRHKAFYLDESGRHVAGRKFYYHHSHPPTDVKGWLPRGGKVTKPTNAQNRYIHPLGPDSVFTFSAHFDNLDQDELNLLLYVLVLEPGMRHKLGYAKPAGLGSVEIKLTRLELIDYAARYTSPGAGKTVYTGDALEQYVEAHIASYVNDRDSITLQDLRRIWRWPGYDNIRYPEYNWFKDNANAAKRLDEVP